jgi:uncharacterized membrane protein required for colicin V production
MHWLDTTIVAVLVAAAVLGAYSGLLMQVFRLVGFAVALYAASLLHEQTAGWLSSNVLRGAEPGVSSAVAYGALFLGVYLLIFLFTLLLERGLRATQLQYLNRLLGAVLAVGKMGLILGLVCYGMRQIQLEQTQQVMEESVTAPLLANGMEQAIQAIPAEYRKEWMDKWGSLNKGLPTLR